MEQQTMDKFNELSKFASFRTNFLKDLKKQICLQPNLIKKHQSRDREKKFDQKLYYANYMTLIYLESNDIDSAFKQNKKVLEIEPNNFNALWNQACIHMSNQKRNDVKLKESVEELRKVVGRRKELLIAKAEVAGMYQYLGVKFNERSIDLYRKVLSDFSDYDEKDPKLYNLGLRWKIYLSSMYSRYLVEGMFVDNVLADPKKLLSEIETLLAEVINADDLIESSVEDRWDAKFSKAMALTELANAKCKCCRRISLQYSHEEIDGCYRKAMETIAPRKKSFILQSYAKYKAYRANTVEEYLESIALLKDAIDVNPENEIAVYELGRTYKMLWFSAENLNDELHRVFSYQNSTDTTPTRASIPPRNSIDPKLIPTSHKIVNYIAFCKSQNPLARDLRNIYLIEAQTYLKQASDQSNSTSCLYLVDLARTFISGGKTREALSCLKKAEKTEFCARTLAYLCEQWAMLIDRMATENSQPSEEPEEVDGSVCTDRAIFLYRESIRYSAQCKVPPLIPFHNLLKLLYEQTQQEENRNNEVLQREYFVIFIAVQDAENSRDILRELTKDDVKTKWMWNLIEQLYTRNGDGDAAVAFTYITVICKAGKHLMPGNEIPNGTMDEKKTFVFEVSKRAVEVLAYPENIISSTFEWLSEMRDSSTQPKSKSICVIAASSAVSEAENVSKILACCTIPCFELSFEISDGTFEASLVEKRDEIAGVLKSAVAVVVVYDEIQTKDNMDRMIGTIQTSFRIDSDKLCLAASESIIQKYNLPSKELPVWRTEAVGCLDAREIIRKHGYPLMETIFFPLVKQPWVECVSNRKKHKLL